MGEGGLSTPEEGDTGEGGDGGLGHKTQVNKHAVPYLSVVVDSDGAKRQHATDITRPRCLDNFEPPQRLYLKRDSLERSHA